MAGVSLLASHGLGRRVGRLRGALLGGIAGAAVGTALIGADHVTRHPRARAGEPRAEDRPAWAFDAPKRALVAGGVGAALLGVTLGVGGAVRRVAGAGMPVRVATGLAAAAAAVFVGSQLWRSFGPMVTHEPSERIPADGAALPSTSTGGARSALEPAQLPNSVSEYLHQPLTSRRAKAYRPELAPDRLHDAVRAYAPLLAGQDATAQAAAAVEEIDRLGGFDRSVLHVVVPAGGGNVDEGLAGIVEAYAGGDAATIGLQYADTPSVLSLNSAEAGSERLEAFLSAVERRLATRPERERPRIVLSGYSLGAEVLRHALADDRTKARIDRMVDGVLLLGPRNLGLGTAMRGLERATVVDDASQLPRRHESDDRHARVVVVRHPADPAGNGSLSLGLRDTRNPDLGDRSSFVPFATLGGTAADMIARRIPQRRGRYPVARPRVHRRSPRRGPRRLRLRGRPAADPRPHRPPHPGTTGRRSARGHRGAGLSGAARRTRRALRDARTSSGTCSASRMM